jgi:hypothetical protein
MAIPTKLNKSDALSHWESIEDNSPIRMTPIDTGKVGSTYTEDTIRLTGSKEFIDSVLSNLKGVLEYENDVTSRLEIIYTQTCEREFTVEDGKRKVIQGELTGAYACYVKAKSRGRGRKGRKPGNGQSREPKAEKEVNPLREVNAGLKLRGRPRKTEITPPALEPTKGKPTAPAYTEPLYAIAKFSMEKTGNDTPDWLEKIEDHPVFAMQTYDDIISLDDAIERSMKQHKLKRADVQKIEITVTDKGQLIFEEF